MRCCPRMPGRGLTRVALLYLAVLVGTFVSEFVQMYVMQYTGQLAMFDLRKQLMEHLQRLDLAFYDRNPVGRLVTRVTTDVDVLNDLFASGLVTILGDVLVLGLHHRHHVAAQPLLTAIMMAAMPFVILATTIFRRSVTQSYRRIRVAIAKNQRVPAGARDGHRGAAIVQSRAAERAGIRGGQPRAHGRLQGRHHGLRLVLSGGGVPLHAGAGGHSDLWRLPRRRAARSRWAWWWPSCNTGCASSGPSRTSARSTTSCKAAMASSERIFKLLDTEATMLAPAAPRARAARDRRHRVRPRLVRLSGRKIGCCAT